MVFFLFLGFFSVSLAAERGPEPYFRKDCPVPGGLLRLDQPSGRSPPVVTTRVIDQGTIGDCYAAAAIAGAESAWNRKKAPYQEVSYLAAAVQSRLAHLEKDGLRTEAPGGTEDPRKWSASEKIAVLEQMFPRDWISGLSEAERDGLLSVRARSRLSPSNGTVLDGFDPCRVIETLNREGYCPRDRNPVEERLNLSKRIQDDSGDLQKTLIHAIERLYLGIQMLRSLDGGAPGALGARKAMIEAWIRELESMVSPGRVCAREGGGGSSAVDGFRALSAELRHAELLRAAMNALKKSETEDLGLKEFMMAALVPGCDTPEQRVPMKPKLSCKVQPFPKEHPILRYEDEVLRTRREEMRKSLEDRWSGIEKALKDGTPLASVCGLKFYQKLGGICTADGKGLKSREDFVRDGLKASEGQLGLTASERDWVRMGGATRDSKVVKDLAGKSEGFGILSNRIVNLDEVAREFDQRVIDRLKSGLPMGATVCAGVLEHPMIDGRSKRDPSDVRSSCVGVGGEPSDSHSVQIIGVRKMARGCQYLVKDSHGKDMSYSRRCSEAPASEKGGGASRNCEPGLIWVNADEMAVNTTELVEID